MKKRGKMKRIFESKKAFEMSFAWMFAIIAGAVILFLAIYFASKMISSERYSVDAQTSAQLSILLDPLETSVEAGKASTIRFNKEMRIYNDKCDVSGNFGYQEIGTTAQSGLGEKWQEPAYGKELYNKYLFSQEIEQGKEFFVFSMPFEFPFKISDLIVFSADKYCFLEATNNIKDGLEGLNLQGVMFTDNKNNCSEGSKIVCFGQSSGCDIAVYEGSVVKGGDFLYYTGNLVYAALFASPEVYECNVKRLINLRLVNLALVYKDKIDFVQQRGCDSLLEIPLTNLINSARSLNSSQDLLALQATSVDEINRINENAVCKIY